MSQIFCHVVVTPALAFARIARSRIRSSNFRSMSPNSWQFFKNISPGALRYGSRVKSAPSTLVFIKEDWLIDISLALRSLNSRSISTNFWQFDREESPGHYDIDLSLIISLDWRALGLCGDCVDMPCGHLGGRLTTWWLLYKPVLCENVWDVGVPERENSRILYIGQNSVLTFFLLNITRWELHTHRIQFEPIPSIQG